MLHIFWCLQICRLCPSLLFYLLHRVLGRSVCIHRFTNDQPQEYSIFQLISCNNSSNITSPKHTLPQSNFLYKLFLQSGFPNVHNALKQSIQDFLAEYDKVFRIGLSCSSIPHVSLFLPIDHFPKQ